MGFFSRSRSKGHYPKHNHGSSHYKRPHGPGGILGKIIEALTGSKRHSHSHSHSYSNRYNGHYQKRHHSKSSWS